MLIHLLGFIFNLLLHSCCKVEVINGAGDLRDDFLSATFVTVNVSGVGDWSDCSHVITDWAVVLSSTIGRGAEKTREDTME